MATKIPTQAKFRDRDASAFSRALNGDITGVGVVAFRGSRSWKLSPRLAQDAVLPKGLGSGIDVGGIRE